MLHAPISHVNSVAGYPAEADEGLYFVATAAGETKVATVQKNKPSQFVFLVPTLVEGTYHLEVRARMGSGTSARELRIGRLDATLTAIPLPPP